MPTSDQGELEAVQRGDAKALEALFARHGEAVRRRILRLVRDSAAAEDLAQEVFLRVWTRADQWQGRGTVKAWLFRIATNLALNHLRALRRRKERRLSAPAPVEQEDEESHVPGWMVDASSLGPEALLDAAETREQIRGLVDALTEEKREVFRMVREEDMEIRSVAEALGIPEGTVKSRLHYALRDLAEAWRKRWEEA